MYRIGAHRTCHTVGLLVVFACAVRAAVLESEEVAIDFVPRVSRAVLAGAEWPSIDGGYSSVFKYQENPECPDTMSISETAYLYDDSVNMSTTKHSNIKENGAVCEGAGEEITLAQDFLASPGASEFLSNNFGNVTRRLLKNQVTLQNALSGRLKGARIGFDNLVSDSDSRICGGASGTKSDELVFWTHFIGSNVRESML